MENNDLSAILSGVMSNPEIMSKISGIMSDPEAMKNIQNAFSGLSSQKDEVKDEAPLLPLNNTHNNDNSRNRTRLIAALKPYLNEERRDKADKLLGLLTLLELSGNAGLFKKQ